MKTIEELAGEAGLLKESWMTNAPKPGLYYASPERLATFAELVRAESAQEIEKLCARVKELESAIAKAAKGSGTASGFACACYGKDCLACQTKLIVGRPLRLDDQGGERN